MDIDDLLTDDIPQKTIDMIKSLPDYGKKVILDCYNENSEFFMHCCPKIICNKFLFKGSKLYHYTDQRGLKGIIKSHEIRLNNIFMMNDNEEIQYTLKLCIEWLKNQGFKHMILDFKDFFNSFSNFNAYIMSFSENDTSQALQNYGDYALSFKNKDIQKMLVTGSIPQQKRKEKCSFSDLNAFSFPLKVVYNKKTQMEYISNVMNAWVSSFKCIRYDLNDMLEIMTYCVKAIFLFSLCFKNPILYQEEEIRFVTLFFDNQGKLKINYNTDGKNYVSFPFQTEILKSVVLSRKAKLTSNDVNRLLKNNQFNNTEVKITKLPY